MKGRRRPRFTAGIRAAFVLLLPCFILLLLLITTPGDDPSSTLYRFVILIYLWAAVVQHTMSISHTFPVVILYAIFTPLFIYGYSMPFVSFGMYLYDCMLIFVGCSVVMTSRTVQGTLSDGAAEELALFRGLFERLPLPIMIHDGTNVLHCNLPCAALFGCTYNDLKKKTVNQLLRTDCSFLPTQVPGTRYTFPAAVFVRKKLEKRHVVSDVFRSTTDGGTELIIRVLTIKKSEPEEVEHDSGKVTGDGEDDSGDDK